MTALDIAALRADTPSCEDMVHFDNAGASLMPCFVYRAMTDYLALEQKVGGYEAAAQSQRAFADFYPTFATFLNAHPDEIAYVDAH